ncbi:MAG: outer membrane lipoprotein carrier protein LolA [Gammaproteobacteria bacterium]
MRGIALVLALLLAPAAPASDLFAQPVSAQALARQLTGRLQQLQRAEGLQGGFAQKKQLAGIARPLTAGGRFLFVRKRGILWHTTTPFDSEFVLTAGKMEVTEGGSVAMSLKTAEQPGLKLVSDIFLAMFALDFDALARHFDLYAIDGKRWRIGLAPRDAALRAVATRIVLAGGDVVNEVVLEDAHGDRTEIRFDAVKHLETVAPAELGRFGP